MLWHLKLDFRVSFTLNATHNSQQQQCNDPHIWSDHLQITLWRVSQWSDWRNKSDFPAVLTKPSCQTVFTFSLNTYRISVYSCIKKRWGQTCDRIVKWSQNHHYLPASRWVLAKEILQICSLHCFSWTHLLWLPLAWYLKVFYLFFLHLFVCVCLCVCLCARMCMHRSQNVINV